MQISKVSLKDLNLGQLSLLSDSLFSSKDSLHTVEDLLQYAKIEGVVTQIAYDQDLPVGMCLSFSRGSCTLLESLYVRSDYRRQGIAIELMNGVSKPFFLFVADNNSRAIKFYSRFGLVVHQTVPRFFGVSRLPTKAQSHRYQIDSDALLMTTPGLRDFGQPPVQDI